MAAIDTADGELDEAFSPLSVTLRLEDDIDVSRGDMIVRAGAAPEPRSASSRPTVCWMSERPLTPGARLRLKHADAAPSPPRSTRSTAAST